MPFPEMASDAEPGYPDPWKTVVRHLFGLRVQATDGTDEDGQTRVVRKRHLVRWQQGGKFQRCKDTS